MTTYYEATAQRDTYAPLTGDSTVDVCVIGGGIAGCSTALHLAQRGYRVVLLEGDCIGHGASGRSGGQLLPGYSCGLEVLERQLGDELAHTLWDISVAAVQLAVSLIKQYNIECDLKFGHLHAAIKPRHRNELLHLQQLHHNYRYQSLHLVEGDELKLLVNSERYTAGLYDSAAAHIHPLNYTLGLARAAAQSGALMHEHTKVISIDHQEDAVFIKTATGHINAKHAVLCCNVDNLALSQQSTRIMPVATYMIATSLLNHVSSAIMDERIAVSDCNFIVDYFRMVNSRLLFGGGVSYSGHANSFSVQRIQQRMLQVFPQLRGVKVEYAWHGMLDISMNRAPDFGRINNNVYYLQGFSGHGLALATMAGKLVADSIAIQSERFDLFSRINHRSFPGGVLRTPLLMLAMLWYRLRDAL